jgi:hypothetical protein
MGWRFFGFPFVMIGCVAVGFSLKEWIVGSVFDGEVLGGIALAGIGAFSFGLTVMTWRLGSIQPSPAERRRTENPESPWLWRSDWGSGQISSETKDPTRTAWLLALIWNAIAIPTPILALRQVTDPLQLLLCFSLPVTGVFLLVRAIRKTVALKKFGASTLELVTIPGVIGGTVRGAIQTGLNPTSNATVNLTLTCVELTSSRDSSATVGKILWRHERVFRAGEIFPGPRGSTIPFEFQIPSDAAETNQGQGPGNIIQWRIDCRADVPGVDYQASFEVPVYRLRTGRPS